MSDRELLLRKISTQAFAVTELNIYLDTHPRDVVAIKKLQEHEHEVKELVNEYESKYGPLTAPENDNKSKWLWVNDPWPWEYEED